VNSYLRPDLRFLVYFYELLCYKCIMENMTPMLKQYHGIKTNYGDCILFFRLGDFYEMFFEDAKLASKILDVVLTSRGAGKAGKVPMCGIPYHAAESYISRLIKSGLKVAICEQVEDPSQAKGIVRRDVTRVITSGTFIDDSNNDPRYILSINVDNNVIGIAFIETSGGTIFTNQYNNVDRALDVIHKLPFYECIYPADKEDIVKGLFKKSFIGDKGNLIFSPIEDWYFNINMSARSLSEHFSVHNLSGFGIDGLSLSVSCAGALLEYMKNMNQRPMSHIDRISIYADTDYMFISNSACRGLELHELIRTIDATLTPMGKRLLRYWVYHPLKNTVTIKTRQNGIRLLRDSRDTARELTKIFRNIPDIEKSITRISLGYTYPKDLLSLRNTLLLVPAIKRITASLSEKNTLFSLLDIPSVRDLLESAINPEIPLSNPEGKIIRQGFNSEMDELRKIQENGRSWLQELQRREIKRTKINSLKIGFNKVFGYYLIVSKANLRLVPGDYIRKQTLVNAERFITPELKEFEEKMLSAEEKICHMEKKLLKDIQREILDKSRDLHALCNNLALLDVLVSLSALARSGGYIQPTVDDSSVILIKDGRHPVVEKYLDKKFIPNDTHMDCNLHQMSIITGPNMAGKSTYIRQNALIVILAQIGSFVPASESRIGIVDKIFTRIGAHDDISKGHSTFMVEMSETAEILNNLSPRSLVILDEIGRGTSTYDGLSLAWAVAEYVIKHKIRTLFATHFHELTALQDEHNGAKNYNVQVKEWKDRIVFLHKIVPGGCDDSYGIYVAKLAGIPKEVISRASGILTQLELSGSLEDKIKKPSRHEERQMTLFNPEMHPYNNIREISKEISQIDINLLTPIDALNKIQSWKKKAGDNG